MLPAAAAHQEHQGSQVGTAPQAAAAAEVDTVQAPHTSAAAAVVGRVMLLEPLALVGKRVAAAACQGRGPQQQGGSQAVAAAGLGKGCTAAAAAAVGGKGSGKLGLFDELLGRALRPQPVCCSCRRTTKAQQTDGYVQQL
jgi:hypothetical protein